MKFTENWQRNCLIALCVVLAVILIVMIFATSYVNHLLNYIGRVDPSDPTLSSDEIADMTEEIDPDYTGPFVDPTDITIDVLPTNPDGPEDDEHIINILLVGQDRREDEKRKRSDVMMLFTFNTEKKTITLTSFLRDTYSYVPGYGYRKLNVPYAIGGFELLNETLEVNFGVHVDANVEVDFYRFVQIIDLLGGVDITLTAKEVDYLNNQMGIDVNPDQFKPVKVGKNHLNGTQALFYSRIRKIDSDFGRTQRQRTVVMAIIEAYKNQSLTKMISMVKEILPMVTTDMTNEEIMNYVVELFPMIASAEYNTMYIPAKGTWESEYVKGLGACLIPDLAANRGILEELFE